MRQVRLTDHQNLQAVIDTYLLRHSGARANSASPNIYGRQKMSPDYKTSTIVLPQDNISHYDEIVSRLPTPFDKRDSQMEVACASTMESKKPATPILEAALT